MKVLKAAGLRGQLLHQVYCMSWPVEVTVRHGNMHLLAERKLSRWKRSWCALSPLWTQYTPHTVEGKHKASSRTDLAQLIFPSCGWTDTIVLRASTLTRSTVTTASSLHLLSHDTKVLSIQTIQLKWEYVQHKMHFYTEFMQNNIVNISICKNLHYRHHLEQPHKSRVICITKILILQSNNALVGYI